MIFGSQLARNASESVPIGLYRLRAIRKFAVTELVAILPPEPLATFLTDGGYLPRGIPMLKRVLALPGQTVCRDDRTITVDWTRVGEARERDSRFPFDGEVIAHPDARRRAGKDNSPGNVQR